MKIVAGLVTVLLGWTLVSITLYIVAALMILYCLMNLVSSLKTDGYSMSTVQKLRTYAKPVIGLAAGICLLLTKAVPSPGCSSLPVLFSSLRAL